MKPEIYDDEILADLEMTTGLPLFRIFTGLWCFADRDGRFEWSPRSLRGKIHPCWDGDMAAALDALASKLYIVRYTVDGKDYGYVRTFAEHQAIHPREPRSTLPAPADHGRALSGKRSDESVDESGSLEIEIEPEVELEAEAEGPRTGRASDGATALHRTRPRRANADSGAAEAPQSELQVRNGAEPPQSKPARKKPACTLPDDLTPNDTVRYLAERLGVALEPEFESFVDHHRAKGSTFSDWQAAIRTWIRNAHKYGARSGPRVRSEPDDRLQRQADRIQMLRAQEAAEERQARGGS